MMERMGRSSISAIGRIYKCSKYMLLENNRKHWTTATHASLSIHYDKPVCTRCYQLQFTSFHTTTDVTAKKHSKKTLKVKQVHFKKDKAGKVVPISTDMTVTELAETLESDVDHVRKVLSYTSARNQFAKCSPDTVIEDIAVIKEVIEKSGYRWLIESKKKKVEKDNKDAERRPPPEADVLVKRPPVVTIMGHVDHGKTTLLDALRHSNIVAKEFGGITQHIGAFSVKLPSSEEMITFLDTPGHAAFSAMRARGAHATDIVVLVVAADDGVMKQTIESLSHAKDSHVPIVVAVNKCDKPEADVESTKHELTQHGLMSEDLGGDTQVIPISALKGTNLEVLQEAILAQAELLELGCDPTGLVEGVVIESCMDPGRGKLSTVLIQRGTLKKGSYLVAGLAHAKVRGMFNDMGRPVQEVAPGMAVEVIGWRELPSAGDLLLQVETEHRAREVIHWRQGQERSKRSEEELKLIQARIDSHDKEYKEMRKKMVAMGIRRAKRMPWTDRKKEAVVEHEGPEVAVVIKGDVDGTVEAILDALDTYSSDQCRLHLLSYGVGDVTEHDIEMAAAFKGELFAFNVNSPERINNLAKTKGVEIHHHNVIYKMMDELRDNLQKKLPAVEVEEVIGEANVLQTFMISDGKHKLPVAGCLCTKGQLKKKKSFKLLRDEEVIFDGPLSSLKHFKNEVDTIKTDVECGVCFHDKHIIPSPEDRVVCYEKKKQKQILEWDLAF